MTIFSIPLLTSNELWSEALPICLPPYLTQRLVTGKVAGALAKQQSLTQLKAIVM
jgi:hypothetical protein